MEHLLNKLARSEQTYIAMTKDSPESLREPLGRRTINCDDHGQYESAGTRYMGKHDIWSRCPTCESERVAKEKQGEAERKAKIEGAKLEALICQAGIPPRFIGRTMDTFKAETDAQKMAFAVAKEYAEKFNENHKKGFGLIFSGNPGTGKSHLAIAILQSIMPDKKGIYTTCMGVIRAVRGTWRKDSEQSENEVLSAYCEADLLVLDEVGVQYGTDGEQTILFDVIDRRYREMRPTIILTNQAKAGLKEFIGDRSYDRLVETSRWVAFDWPSYRAQARKERA
jgi:DNA replication protein DnaC